MSSSSVPPESRASPLLTEHTGEEPTGRAPADAEGAELAAWTQGLYVKSGPGFASCPQHDFINVSSSCCSEGGETPFQLYRLLLLIFHPSAKGCLPWLRVLILLTAANGDKLFYFIFCCLGFYGSSIFLF